MECEICKKKYTTKYTLRKHKERYHNDDDNEEIGDNEESADNDSDDNEESGDNYSDDNESHMQVEEKSNASTEMDSFIAELNEDDDELEEKLEFKENELSNWTVIMRITNLKDKLSRLKSIDELWQSEENLQICVDTLRYGVHRLTCIIRELKNGEVLPHIKEEIKRLRKSWRVAFNNRKYLIMEMLKANENNLSILLTEEEEVEHQSSSSDD